MKYSNTISYTVPTLADATGLGRSTIFIAINLGELEAFKPKVAGKVLNRLLITPEAAKTWINSIQTPARPKKVKTAA